MAGNVTMAAICSEPHSDSLQAFEREFGPLVILRQPPIPSSPTGWAKLGRKFRQHWPTASEPRIIPADRSRLTELIQAHNLLWIHGLATADALAEKLPAPTVLDLDDLNQTKFSLRAATMPNTRQRLSHKLQAWKWRCREQEALSRFSIVNVCSEPDRALLQNHPSLRVLPNGFDRLDVASDAPLRDQLRLGFIGKLTYPPNRDGLAWFVREIWPGIRRQTPEATLRVVGHLPQDTEFLAGPGIEALGFVQDLTDEFNSWAAMIVPLRFGGGTRIKILEAFSRKCPVIATALGAYGLDAQPGRDLLVAEEPQDFAQACTELLNSSQRRDQLAQAAWKLFSENYTWDRIYAHTRDIARQALASVNPAADPSDATDQGGDRRA